VDGHAEAVLQLRRSGGSGSSSVGARRVALLRAIAAEGTISGAARALNLSYRGAWDAVQALNNLFARPLVAAQTGGRDGGTAALTPAGERLLAGWRQVEQEVQVIGDRLAALVAGSEQAEIWRMAVRTSARNMFAGQVVSVAGGAVNDEVVLDIGGAHITAIVTRESTRALGLAPGVSAYALVKSSFVTVAAGDCPRTSARNAIAGTVVRHETGAVNDEVVIGFGEGRTITATITSGSAAALGLEPGSAACALVKASHVILGVE
jgi:molybdate transport system regulatory protein